MKRYIFRWFTVLASYFFIFHSLVKLVTFINSFSII
jgi:hypothetical protein